MDPKGIVEEAYKANFFFHRSFIQPSKDDDKLREKDFFFFFFFSPGDAKDTKFCTNEKAGRSLCDYGRKDWDVLFQNQRTS